MRSITQIVAALAYATHVKIAVSGEKPPDQTALAIVDLLLSPLHISQLSGQLVQIGKMLS